MYPVDIDTASPADHEWCARLMASNEPWITFKRNLESCRVVLSRPGTDLFVARSKTLGLVGFVLLAAHGFAGSPYVASIGVAAEARGQQVGAQLLAFSEERYQGRDHLFLLVSSFNSRAQQFYLRHGFAFIGELKDYLVAGHSELIFHKRLS